MRFESTELNSHVNGASHPATMVRFRPQTTEPCRLTSFAEQINSSYAKRFIDLFGAASGIVLLVPAFFIIALLIRIESRGPILFRQERYGAGKQVFVMYKFRSMTVLESRGAFQQATLNDTRITRVGRVLRRTSLDELPQLFNVLLGHMSLVGPRPHAVPMDDAFVHVVRGYAQRHLVRPGLTGLAQVSGCRGPTSAPIMIENRVRKDRAYIKGWSVILDLKILARTPVALVSPNAL